MDLRGARESENVEVECLGVVTTDTNLGIDCHLAVKEVENHGLDLVEKDLGVKFTGEEREHLRGAYTGNYDLSERGESIVRRLFGNLIISDRSAMEGRLKKLMDKTKEESKVLSDVFKKQGLLPKLTIE